jgi:hypothetical protein
MNVLRQALADYLAVRRALGYRLARAEKLLAQFLAFVEDRGEEHLTIETALAWAMAPTGADPNWMSRRLSDVRRFAIHLRGIDPATQVPPAEAVTTTLRGSYRKASYRTLIGIALQKPNAPSPIARSGALEPTLLDVNEELTPALRALADPGLEADEFLFTLWHRADQHQHAFGVFFHDVTR